MLKKALREPPLYACSPSMSSPVMRVPLTNAAAALTLRRPQRPDQLAAPTWPASRNSSSSLASASARPASIASLAR